MSEEADKPHAASQQKLDKQRAEGEIARAADVNAFALYLGLLVAAVAVAPVAARRMLDAGGAVLADADRLAFEALSSGDLLARTLVGETIVQSALWVAPAAACVALAIVAMRTWVVAPKRMAPKLSRISPVSGAKNKFGPTGLFEFAKSAAKLCLYGATLAWILWAEADRIVATAALPLAQSTMLMGRLLLAFLAVVVGVAAVLGVVDFVWQRHAHAAKNRMSQQEVRDEHKDAEGDPNTKARRRQRAYEIATNKMLADVPVAAVVVVNPTHYAVALKWSPLDPTPPVCVAKGVDAIAARIRARAIDADVPIFSDPPTARALHATVELGEPIPREHFQAVAAAIRFADDLRRAARGGTRG